MNKYMIVILFLLLTGCGPKYRIYAIDKEDMLFVPVPGAKIEWDDTVYDGNDIPGDLWFTTSPGWFISEKTLAQVYDAEAQEDLTPSIWDRIWRGLGL
jgi:hypothetical protein